MITQRDLDFKLKYKNISLTDEQVYDLVNIINFIIDEEVYFNSINNDYDLGYREGYEEGRKDGYEEGYEEKDNALENMYVETYNEAYNNGYDQAVKVLNRIGEHE